MVVYDYQMAQIVDRAGVDIVSVGDSVGVNMWGQRSELDVTLDQMLLACKAVRRGVERALVSCDFPYGPMQEGAEAAVRAATRLVEDGRRGHGEARRGGGPSRRRSCRSPLRGFRCGRSSASRLTRRSGTEGCRKPSHELAGTLNEQFVAEASAARRGGSGAPRFH